MKKYHLPKFSIIHYYGENYVIENDYWTTAETIAKAIQNIRVNIARKEMFVSHVGEWIHIALDRSDLEVVE